MLLALGERRVDVRHRAVVLGLLPAGDGGAMVDAAARLCAAGADAVELGGGDLDGVLVLAGAIGDDPGVAVVVGLDRAPTAEHRHLIACAELRVSVVAASVEQAVAAEAAGVDRARILLAAGSARAEIPVRAELGYPLVLPQPADDAAADAIQALGIALGCRALRATDARSARRVAFVLAALLEAAAA